MADLVFVETRPMTGRVVPIRAGTTIGREGTDIVLPDPEVSRCHAQVRAMGEAVAIEDMGSTNGTWVNERRATAPVVLREGDVLRFGHTVWHVRHPGAQTRVTGTTEEP